MGAFGRGLGSGLPHLPCDTAENGLLGGRAWPRVRPRWRKLTASVVEASAWAFPGPPESSSLVPRPGPATYPDLPVSPYFNSHNDFLSWGIHPIFRWDNGTWTAELAHELMSGPELEPRFPAVFCQVGRVKDGDGLGSNQPRWTVFQECLRMLADSPPPAGPLSSLC